VNLGAGTTNSNLKNNYGTVKVGETDTGQQFMGCIIGDHAKTGIGTLITTGAVIGVAANVFGGGVTPQVVPSFTWGLTREYELEKFLAAAKVALARRGKRLGPKERERLEQVFKLTRGERAF
jgi:hypothetical protein